MEQPPAKTVKLLQLSNPESGPESASEKRRAMLRRDGTASHGVGFIFTDEERKREPSLVHHSVNPHVDSGGGGGAADPAIRAIISRHAKTFFASSQLASHMRGEIASQFALQTPRSVFEDALAGEPLRVSRMREVFARLLSDDVSELKGTSAPAHGQLSPESDNDEEPSNG